MFRVLLTSAALAALSTAFSPAHAADLIDEPTVVEAPVIEDEPSQLYIAARLGVTDFRDTQFDLEQAAAVPTSIDNSYDHDYAGFVAIGLDSNVGARVEIEVGHGQFDIDTHTVNALNARFGDGDAFGQANVTTVMGNAYYEMQLGRFAPYVSAGLGYAHVEFEDYGIVLPAGGAAGLPGGPVVALDDTSGGLAWQIGAGVSFDLTSNLALELGYRYSGIQSLDFAAIDGTMTDVQMRAHTAMLGVRMAF